MFLLYRLFCIQFLHSDFLKPKAKDMHKIELELKPGRGEICDRNRNLLAISVPLPSVYGDPAAVKDPAETARVLAPVLDLAEDFIFERLARKKRFVWIKRKITKEQKEEIRALNLRGIGFLDESTRFYPKGIMAAHVLGFVDIDSKGLAGREFVCERYLAGKPGVRLTEKDASGREVLSWRDQETPPVEGYRVVLSIDEVIQDIVEQEVEQAWQKFNAQAAMAIVVAPASGEILALVNRPTFDPNPGKYSESESDSRRNRVITDTYEAGSVFKIFTAAAALNEGAFSLRDPIFCERGRFRTPGGVLHDHHPHGMLTFQQVIEKSSNIGVAKVGMELGKKRLHGYLSDFGFGRKTGVLLPGEVTGVLRPVSRWSRMSITRIPMGHEVSTTSLQLAMAVAATANGGKLMKPIIVKRIEDAQGRTIKEFKPEVVAEILNPDTVVELKKALHGVVGPGGTAKKASLADFQVAGKTGTAQKLEPNGTYSHTYFMASFAGFVPVEDPQLMILAVFDSPRPLYYGGTVAAPVFKGIAEKTLSYLNIAPGVQPAGTIMAKQ